ncbi:predicted protein [Nematostella vectensis]|uniref:4-coumarate--CoA ligase n=2 Tax=Nematostella vectensis TaxID=45351 RepID=A7SSP2_NEMVE|nr:predicted protein [Nematostella vectensis]|eukprot:XP_001625358.1 predicted protein [Nematostella vectensis]
MASALTRKGFKQGEVLAIMCPNIPEFAIAYFAAILIGGIVTSMNPLYTGREVAHQLVHSQASWLLTVPPCIPRAMEGAKEAGVANVYVVGEAEGCASLSELLEDDGTCLPTDLSIKPREDIAALPYSSGTTGLPKGVQLTHYNLIADSCIVMGESFTHYSRDSHVLALLPFYHSYGLMVNLANVLLVGGRVVCIQRFDQEAFLKTIQNEKITHAALVPPIMIFLAKHEMVDQYDLSSLIDITVGAAGMGEELMQSVKDRLSNLKYLRQGYGMTELSPVSHVVPLDTYNPKSVGVLLPNLECKIIDLSSGEEVEQGKEGEICIRGPTVMKGYLKNPEATARTLDSEGWLHTGDIGHCDQGDFFYITDRLKELIKYKGFQVPPAELEALLLSHPDVEDVAVIGVPDVEAGELPKAFVVRKKESLTVEDVTGFVNSRVAPYKRLRGGVEFTDEIPKSTSGKILR